jgi:hypothetical protein
MESTQTDIRVHAKKKKNLQIAPHSPGDITFMMISVFEKEIPLPETCKLFPFFGPRLRKLKTYLESQQPRTFLQFWRDERGDRSWWVFWSFLFFIGLGYSSLS